MPETIERTESQNAGSAPSNGAVRTFRWTRTHTIWTLIVLSLIPGVVIALFRNHWLEMPAGVKGAVYLTSAILIVAAVSLIMTAGSKNREHS
jgi:hypothetical protein